MGNIVLKITALIFGIVLWFLVISQKDFQLSIEVPLNFVKLPETMAIASKPPHSLPITVEGKSWDLIRLQQILRDPNQNSIAMVVDLQQAELGTTRIHLGAKNFLSAGFPDIRFAEPDNQFQYINIDIDTRITRNVPIKTMASFSAAQGYLIADEPKISPDEVLVSGARNALTRIIDIPTDSAFFDTLRESQEFTIPLNFSSLPAFVNPNDSIVKISIDIQKMASKTYTDIPVNLIGFFDKKTYSVNPSVLSVEITGGNLALDSISASNIELVMEFNRFAIEDADSLSPTVKLSLPPHINREMSIKAIQLKPEKVALVKKEAKPVAPVDSLEEVTP
jgi:YbbR domain-containing protein